MRVHKLKTLPDYFDGILRGKKTFEFRLNDRNFQVGDKLQLQECSDGKYTGRELLVNVRYIMDNSYAKINGFPYGYVMMSVSKSEAGIQSKGT